MGGITATLLWPAAVWPVSLLVSVSGNHSPSQRGHSSYGWKHRSIRRWIHAVALDGRSCTLWLLESSDEPMGGMYLNLGQYDLRKRDRLRQQIPAPRNYIISSPGIPV